MRSLALALPFALVVAACSVAEDKQAAVDAVRQFHQRLDDNRPDLIYAEASPEFRRATSQADLTRLLVAVHAKLGSVEATREKGWRVNYGTGGNVVALVVDTQFASGKGTEQFTWRVAGGQARLVGYNINSTDLILK